MNRRNPWLNPIDRAAIINGVNIAAAKRNKVKRKFETTEHAIQVAICDYLDVCSSRIPLTYFAIPNGGFRSVRVAKMLKDEGARAGAPDLAVLLRGGVTVWLELKRAKGRLSGPQQEFANKALGLNHFYEVAFGLDAAVEILARYGVGRK